MKLVVQEETGVLARFLRKVEKTDDCWLWLASTKIEGSGQFWFKGEMVAAPRVAWLLFYGPIPKGMMVLRSCKTRNCVCPEHLFLSENAAEAKTFPVLEDRFWDKVKKGNGCWPWVAACSPLGYGEFWKNGRMRPAHRVAWEIAHGGVPDGLDVLHHCDNPPMCTTRSFVCRYAFRKHAGHAA